MKLIRWLATWAAMILILLWGLAVVIWDATLGRLFSSNHHA